MFSSKFAKKATIKDLPQLKRYLVKIE